MPRMSRMRLCVSLDTDIDLHCYTKYYKIFSSISITLSFYAIILLRYIIKYLYTILHFIFVFTFYIILFIMMIKYVFRI